MSTPIEYQKEPISYATCKCIICGSKAIGINFGVLTCAPCKAFFRRNARRKQVLEYPCQHQNFNAITTNEDRSVDYTSAIRQCSSCRLRRCFNMGMRKELIRSEEENIRHKQLVDLNRRKKEFLRQKQLEKHISIPQLMETNKILSESDWRHLSNIVSAYEKHCLQSYIKQRSNMFADVTAVRQNQRRYLENYIALPMCLTSSLRIFIESLPAFHSLSRLNRTYLCQNNVRPLLFPNMIELNQLCFSEPWQISQDETTWSWICGPELYREFVHTKQIAERSLITDPIIARLWLVILFFSSSLAFFFYDNGFLKIPRKKTSIVEIQNWYATLLWKYLLHRYGYDAGVKIYFNLITTYLQMQHVGLSIGIQVRTRSELLVTYATLNQILTSDLNDH